MVANNLIFLRERNYLAAGITHFFVDVLNNSRNLLVAILAVALGLSNAQVGIVLLVYNIGNAIAQPFFGLLADRIGTRWLIVGGMGWMILFYGLAAVSTDMVALITTTIASLGSGMFHPSGTKVATRVAQPYRNTATALFFLSGSMGLFVGPIAAGYFLEQYGRIGFIALPLIALVAFVGVWQWAHDVPEVETAVSQTATPTPTKIENAWRRTITLIIIILCNYSISITLITYLPKYFTEQNLRQDQVGLITGIFLFGGAIGTLIGGFLGDRFESKTIITITMLLAYLPLTLYLNAPSSTQAIWLLAIGFFTSLPHALLVLNAQKLFPQKQGMASGLVLGFMFFSGSLGSALLGVLADRIGLDMVLSNLGYLALVVAITALLLPRESQ